MHYLVWLLAEWWQLSSHVCDLRDTRHIQRNGKIHPSTFTRYFRFCFIANFGQRKKPSTVLFLTVCIVSVTKQQRITHHSEHTHTHRMCTIVIFFGPSAQFSYSSSFLSHIISFLFTIFLYFSKNNKHLKHSLVVLCL